MTAFPPRFCQKMSRVTEKQSHHRVCNAIVKKQSSADRKAAIFNIITIISDKSCILTNFNAQYYSTIFPQQNNIKNNDTNITIVYKISF